MSKLSQSRLRELLRYDPVTGVFTWLVAPNGRIQVGTTAGTVCPKGYVKIQVDQRLYSAGRLATLYMTGQTPPRSFDVDHIDTYGAKSDNRWVNLRLATRKQNSENTRLRSNSTSGFRGVAFHKSTGKFAAHMKFGGRKRHLGLFSDANDAHEFVSLARAITMPFSPDARIE